MLAAPKQEYPEFPAALSLLTLLAPDAIADALGRRAAALEAAVAAHEEIVAREGTNGLPRILTLDTDYLLAVTAAELAWVRGVLADLTAGRLAWTADQLAALDGDTGADAAPEQ